MAVVTISRQMGSYGLRIAQAVAGQLGYQVVWRDLINQAAMRAGTPEVALAAIDELGLLGICPSPAACRAYCQAVQQVMEELAAAGNVVIVGRAGQVILANRPDVLHVRIHAPLQVRAERIAEQQSIALECALAQVEASDKARRKYLQSYYRARWENPDLYDLLINTARTRVSDAVRVICAALPPRQPDHLSVVSPDQDASFEFD